MGSVLIIFVSCVMNYEFFDLQSKSKKKMYGTVELIPLIYNKGV